MAGFFGQGLTGNFDPAYSHGIQGILDGDDLDVAADDGWRYMARADGVGIGRPDDAEQGGPVGDVYTLAAGRIGKEEFFRELGLVMTLFKADAGILHKLAGNDVLARCQGMAAADIETGRKGAKRRKFQLVFAEQVLEKTLVHMGQEEDTQMALPGDDVVDDLRRPPFTQGEYAGAARLDVLQGMDEGFVGEGIVLGRNGQDLGKVLSFFCLEMVVHGRGMGEDVTGIVQEFQPCRCEGDAMAVPLDQGQGEFFFQIPDNCAQAGLGDVEGLCGS